mmetsp:Transcript_91932/g.192231  ORF Transcript_91932/g.192231 Transcript_91932/m.192231 type:complete len:225 (+) Transcript_91932:1774-2448(+)
MLQLQEVASFPQLRFCPLEEATNLGGCEVPLLLTGLQSSLGKPHLEDLQPKDFIFDHSAHHQPVGANLFVLPDSMSTVNRLGVDSRVPGRICDDDTIGLRQVKSISSHASREQQHLATAVVALKRCDSLGTCRWIGLAVDPEVLDALWQKHAKFHEVQQLDALREDQDPMTPRDEVRQHCGQAPQLGALRQQCSRISRQLVQELSNDRADAERLDIGLDLWRDS